MKPLESAIARQPKLPRFLCHLYQRLRLGRLTLVTGAGISVDAKVPSWYSLLDRLAEKPDGLKADFEKHRESGLNQEYLGQIIYHRIKNDCPISPGTEMREEEINDRWATAIHEALYKDLPENIEEIVLSHPYLAELRDFARQVPLVINFNFDDLLADSIGSGSGVLPNRASAVVWHPPLVERADTTTLYHVNGVLPRVSLRKRSPQLIFTEDSFSDALARSPNVSGEYLFLRFIQNTMLIIGHSLNDKSLKNYLRQNRDKSPANHHYVIHWLESPSSMSNFQRHDIFDANLELYNLITIFLTSTEIKEVLRLLNLNKREFQDALDGMGDDKRHRYLYYIVGPVASGKSSILEQLRCFQTYEEWTRTPLKEMYWSIGKLDDATGKKIDQFVYGELKEKNQRMQAASVGFHFMDRGPLDLYAFCKDEDEKKRKTGELREFVTRDKPLQPGEIIFLTASGSILVKRNAGRGRFPKDSGDADYLDRQAENLKSIYNAPDSLATDSLSPGEAAKKIARHVLLEGYKPTELMNVLARFE